MGVSSVTTGGFQIMDIPAAWDRSPEEKFRQQYSFSRIRDLFCWVVIDDCGFERTFGSALG